QRKSLPIARDRELAVDELLALIGVHVHPSHVRAVLKMVRSRVVAARQPMLLDDLADLRLSRLGLRLLRPAAIQLAVAGGLLGLGLRRRGLLLVRRARRRFAG